MDIKLRAKLSAYACVETFEQRPGESEQEHACKFMHPITPEQIDEQLFTNKPEAEVLPQDPATSTFGTTFIDSLF